MSRLFVGNLPYSCTEGDLRGLFEGGFVVRDVRIVTDRETGRSRGFAFVELEGDAAGAIQRFDGHELGGRRLAVREAHERSGKPPRRNGDRKQVQVEAVVRRSAGPPRDARPRPRGGDGRRWHAPPEPGSIDDWGAPARDEDEE